MKLTVWLFRLMALCWPLAHWKMCIRDRLWETTMDPNVRTLLQVTVEDAVVADRTFDMLMGDEVAPRRRFITTHASEVRNLDV